MAVTFEYVVIYFSQNCAMHEPPGECNLKEFSNIRTTLSPELLDRLFDYSFYGLENYECSPVNLHFN